MLIDMKLNKDQKRLTGEVFGNLSVGWFGAGIIIPAFTKQISLGENILSFFFGLGLFLIFYFLALYILKR